MKNSTTAICLIASGILMVQGPLLARGGGGFGGGGFNGGSIGNAGNVGNHPYYPGGGYGYAYQMGATEFAGDEDLRSGDFGADSGAPTAYTGTGGGPPEELQDVTGINVQGGEIVTDGPSWANDWWANDPRSAEEAAAAGPAGSAVASLPRGSYTVYASNASYYYSLGTFYQEADSGYQVVTPPIGIEVRQLPNAAEIVNANNQQYFVYNDIYYQALYGGSGVVYKVVENPNS